MNYLYAGGGQVTDKRVAQVKAGWGKEIYQKAKDTKVTDMNGSEGKGWELSNKKSDENGKSGNKYKWNGKYKYLGGTKEKYWILNNKKECWGLIVEWKGKDSGTTNKWRIVKGKEEGETCQLEVGKRRWIFEDGKWGNEENSVFLDR